MHLIKIEILDNNYCKIIEQTWRPRSYEAIYKTSKGIKIVCCDFPDYLFGERIYLQGNDKESDGNCFRIDGGYVSALNEFCNSFGWRFVICI